MSILHRFELSFQLEYLLLSLASLPINQLDQTFLIHEKKMSPSLSSRAGYKLT